MSAPGDSADIVDLHRMGFDPVERGEHYGRRADPGRFDAQTEQRHAADTWPSGLKPGVAGYSPFMRTER
jgi:NAD(P)H dehydrogenase (quinone)